MPGISVNDNGTVKAATGFHVNDNGTVKSVAEAWVNDAGTVKKFWPAIGPPSAISNLAVSGSTSNSLTLTWSAATANGSPVTGYEISYGTDGVNFPNTKNVGVVVTDTVVGLAGATTYYFRIRANSALGFAPYSNIANGTTQTATIPQAPTISTRNAQFYSMGLRITQGGGGTPTTYEVERNGNPTPGTAPTTGWVSAGSFAYTGSPQDVTISGLTEAFSHSFRVRAVNGAGTSSWSNVAYGVTAGSVSGGSIGCAIDPEDVGAFKDTGFGTNSAASGNAGQAFGTNYGVSVPGTTLARFARSGNTTMTIWLEAASLDPGAFTRITIGSGAYSYTANVSPPGSAGGTSGTLWQQSWTVPSAVAGDWLDGAIINVQIGRN